MAVGWGGPAGEGTGLEQGTGRACFNCPGAIWEFPSGASKNTTERGLECRRRPVLCDAEGGWGCRGRRRDSGEDPEQSPEGRSAFKGCDLGKPGQRRGAGQEGEEGEASRRNGAWAHVQSGGWQGCARRCTGPWSPREVWGWGGGSPEGKGAVEEARGGCPGSAWPQAAGRVKVQDRARQREGADGVRGPQASAHLLRDRNKGGAGGWRPAGAAFRGAGRGATVDAATTGISCPPSCSQPHGAPTSP